MKGCLTTYTAGSIFVESVTDADATHSDFHTSAKLVVCAKLGDNMVVESGSQVTTAQTTSKYWTSWSNVDFGEFDWLVWWMSDLFHG